MPRVTLKLINWEGPLEATPATWLHVPERAMVMFVFRDCARVQFLFDDQTYTNIVLNRYGQELNEKGEAIGAPRVRNIPI